MNDFDEADECDEDKDMRQHKSSRLRLSITLFVSVGCGSEMDLPYSLEGIMSNSLRATSSSL